MRIESSKLLYKKFVATTFNPKELEESPTFDWIQSQSGLPWLELDIDIPYQRMLEETNSVQNFMVPHRESYGESKGWKSFCLHGKSFDSTQANEYYNDDRLLTWTKEALELMPFTVDFFQKIWPADSYQRLRLMLLEPGGYITIHKDSRFGGLQPVNISLNNPKECNFVFENYGTVPFAPGRAFWLDVSNLHVIFNNSTQARWHIIVHQDIKHPKFQQLIANSYKLLYNKINEISDHNNS